MIEEQKRKYDQFQLIKWQIYRKLENERIEVEIQEKKKRQIILFWVSMQMAKKLALKVWDDMEWKWEDK